MIFLLFIFEHDNRSQLYNAKVMARFSFLVSSSSISTKKSEKIFLLSRKIFCKRKLSFTFLDFREMLLREQKGRP